MPHWTLINLNTRLNMLTTAMLFLEGKQIWFNSHEEKKWNLRSDISLYIFLYLISYQMSRVFNRRIRDRLPFLMYTEELKLLTFMHLYCQLKSLYIIQRNYLLDNDSKLYLLYIGGLQAFMSLGKNEMKTHSHRQTSWLLLFLLRKEYHRGIVLPRKEKNCSNTRHRVCN